MSNTSIIHSLFVLAKDLEPIGSSRLAACIVRKDKIISYGFSQLKSHPFQVAYSKNPDAIFLHAETDAIKNALKRIRQKEISKCTLYIARAKHDDTNHKEWVYGMAMPCEGCAGAIATFDIRKVVYTTGERDHYKYM